MVKDTSAHVVIDDDEDDLKMTGASRREACVPIATLKLIAAVLAISISAWIWLLSAGGRHCWESSRRKANGYGSDSSSSSFSSVETTLDSSLPFRRSDDATTATAPLAIPGYSPPARQGQSRSRPGMLPDGAEASTDFSNSESGSGPGPFGGGGGRQGDRSSFSSSSSALSLSSSSSAFPSQDEFSSSEEDEDATWHSRKQPTTSINNIVFGIAAAASLWDARKSFVKLWWRPEYRGFVWFEEPVARSPSDRDSVPQFRISEEISDFLYTNANGGPSGIRLSRIVSETFRMGLKHVHWFVMGDDDTIFSAENLAAVLSKYDHREMHYIGSHSESHTQNIEFSYKMAFGGGGIAISYRLAEALAKMQDGCLARYPGLYGSDDRLQACIAELGVPLTREPGFHQMDIYGNPFGLFSAHPVAPFISMHHLEMIDPLFPKMTMLDGLKHLSKSMHIDPGSFLQQSFCIDRKKAFSVSVAWGYSVQFFPLVMTARELEKPELTFTSWHRRKIRYEFPFNTRVTSKSVCQRPSVFYMEDIGYDVLGRLVSIYKRDPDTEAKRRRAWCRSAIVPNAEVQEVKVIKEPVDRQWYKNPRRMCCKEVSMKEGRKTAIITIGKCIDGEIIA